LIKPDCYTTEFHQKEAVPCIFFSLIYFVLFVTSIVKADVFIAFSQEITFSYIPH